MGLRAYGLCIIEWGGVVMQNESSIEKLHPDANAGISRFLAVFAAVGLTRIAKLGSELSTRHPRVDLIFQGHTGPLTIDALPLTCQLEAAKDVDVELALRPLFGAALTTAYGALKSKAGLTAKDDRPIVQFFRHVRNGISHNNMFDIRGDGPMRPAKWRGMEVTKSLNGTVVLYKFLRPADVLRLINDAYSEVLES